MEITKEIFEAQRQPRFGASNPERMQLAFWEWMIRGGEGPPADAEGLAQFGQVMRDGKLKSTYGPYRARDRFGVPPNCGDGPIWTFDRMGATQTVLSDGRALCIGGEHEDYYDLDFCIYNDLVVFGPSDEIEIYGYPAEVFPPTDFHTATLVGRRVIVIGGLGYKESRQAGNTSVYSLDTSGYQISKIETTGENPGWLSRHEAVLDSQGLITVTGGKLIDRKGDRERYRRNCEDYTLDLESRAWRRTTSRNWQQFSIRTRDPGTFGLDRCPKPQELLPRNLRTTARSEKWNEAQAVVDGVPVLLCFGVSLIDVIVQGALPDDKVQQLVEEVRLNAEALADGPCVVD